MTRSPLEGLADELFWTQLFAESLLLVPRRRQRPTCCSGKPKPVSPLLRRAPALSGGLFDIPFDNPESIHFKRVVPKQKRPPGTQSQRAFERRRQHLISSKSFPLHLGPRNSLLIKAPLCRHAPQIPFENGPSPGRSGAQNIDRSLACQILFSRACFFRLFTLQSPAQRPSKPVIFSEQRNASEVGLNTPEYMFKSPKRARRADGEAGEAGRHEALRFCGRPKSRTRTRFEKNKRISECICAIQQRSALSADFSNNLLENQPHESFRDL